jgi:ATP-dependent DNA helicase RecQ
MTPGQPNLDAGLAEFGLTSFRPGQREVIDSVLEGQDSLCIMPTGGGKSLCYQLPAVLRDGVTLVVSPLIALMKDQVDGLEANGVQATFINSSLTFAEQQTRQERMTRGEYDLVYVAPERLRNSRFLDALRATTVQLLAVDEAHCISEWGHDFRPDYARLGWFRERLGFPQTIALTATATPDVRADVVKQLRLRSPRIFITGFARPNLRFEVRSCSGAHEKNEELLKLLEETPGAGIIYGSTRKGCDELVALLRNASDRKIGLYHAGLETEQRRLVQERFMSGEVEIIVATNAFGMGIDRADLRFVIHYNMPGTLEAYYQEAGRAGRDGEPASCALLFSYADRYIQEFFIENRYPSREIVRQVYSYLRSLDQDPIQITLQDLKERLDLSIGAEGVGACEQLLEKSGAIERLDSQQNMASVKLDSDLPTLVDLLPRGSKVQRKVLRVIEQHVKQRRSEWVFFQPPQLAAKAELDRDSFTRAVRELVKLRDFDYVPPFRGRAIHLLRRECAFNELDIDFDELDRRKQAEIDKLERVIQYARTRRCRQLEILDYFGDPTRTKCHTCDRCAPSDSTSGEADSLGEECSINEGVLETVRIALSGAARTHGRIGKHLLGKMLCGSKAAQVTKMRLDQLSTFGLLDDLRQTEAIELLDALVEAGLLEQVELNRHRPVIRITDSGGQVMRKQREADFTLTLNPRLSRKLSRRRRAAQAEPAAKPAVPPNSPVDTPLRETSVSSPVDISSDGPMELETGDSPSQPETPRRAYDSATGPRPSHYWTWRLLSDRFTLAECAQIRRIDEATILSHLSRSADEGLEVAPEWFLEDHQLAAIQPLAELAPSERLRAVVEQLPAGLCYEHLALYLKCRPEPVASPSDG